MNEQRANEELDIELDNWDNLEGSIPLFLFRLMLA